MYLTVTRQIIPDIYSTDQYSSLVVMSRSVLQVTILVDTRHLILSVQYGPSSNKDLDIEERHKNRGREFSFENLEFFRFLRGPNGGFPQKISNFFFAKN